MSQLPNEVASLLIPLSVGKLLVPNTNVAEIIPYLQPAKLDATPDWHLGIINWRDLSIPCISFEKCSTGEIDGEYKSERLAIFNTLDSSTDLNFYAIAIGGIPRLMRVVQEDVVEEDAECSPVEQAKVQINGEAAAIPDLLAVEKLLLDVSRAINEQD